jgi:hypothetical protein
MKLKTMISYESILYDVCKVKKGYIYSDKTAVTSLVGLEDIYTTTASVHRPGRALHHQSCTMTAKTCLMKKLFILMCVHSIRVTTDETYTLNNIHANSRINSHLSTEESRNSDYNHLKTNSTSETTSPFSRYQSENNIEHDFLHANSTAKAPVPFSNIKGISLIIKPSDYDIGHVLPLNRTTVHTVIPISMHKSDGSAQLFGKGNWTENNINNNELFIAITSIAFAADVFCRCRGSPTAGSPDVLVWPRLQAPTSWGSEVEDPWP